MTNRTNRNNYAHQKDRSLKRKLFLMEEKGMKCEICGYDKNISALEFHHINPNNKSFPLDARRLSNYSIEKLEEEAKKCMLLCSNCHREIHHPYFDKNNIRSTLSNLELEIEKLKKEYIESRHKDGKGICPVCGKRFKYVSGKKYCSENCKFEAKHYPSYDDIIYKYDELKSWERVAQYYGISRKAIAGIRKRHNKSLVSSVE